jgi:hypothetical protein
MHSDILACERSTYPVLLECLKCLSHDVRPLQLVNKSMCAAFRHFKQQVDEYTAEREQMRQETQELARQLQDLLCDFSRQFYVERSPVHMQQRMASSGPLVIALRVRAIEPPPVIDLEPRNEGRTVSYSNNISDNSFINSFASGSRTFDPAQLATGAAVDTAVIEVD